MTVEASASVGNVGVAFRRFFSALPLVHCLPLRMRLATLTGLGTDEREITRFCACAWLTLQWQGVCLLPCDGRTRGP